MGWIQRNTRLLYLAALVLLGLAAFGPWAPSSDGVPPPEWCREPLLILGERCVRIMPGTEILSFLFMVIASLPVSLLSPESTPLQKLRELSFVLILFFLFLPYLSTLLAVFLPDSRRLRIFSLLSPALAAIPGTLIFMSRTVEGNAPPFLRTWGFWLYLAILILLLLVGIASTRRRISPGIPPQPEVTA